MYNFSPEWNLICWFRLEVDESVLLQLSQVKFFFTGVELPKGMTSFKWIFLCWFRLEVLVTSLYHIKSTKFTKSLPQVRHNASSFQQSLKGSSDVMFIIKGLQDKVSFSVVITEYPSNPDSSTLVCIFKCLCKFYLVPKVFCILHKHKTSYQIDFFRCLFRLELDENVLLKIRQVKIFF